MVRNGPSSSSLPSSFLLLVCTDGCQRETRSLSLEYNVQVPWWETEIKKVVTIDCPCGNLNATIHGGRTLVRKCGGSYTYGAEWGDVTNNCAFSNITFQLCDITTVCHCCHNYLHLCREGVASSFTHMHTPHSWEIYPNRQVLWLRPQKTPPLSPPSTSPLPQPS